MCARKQEFTFSKRAILPKWISKNFLLISTLTGVFSGLITGFALRPLQPSMEQVMLISYPGELFLRTLKLVTLPLIISSLIAGTSSISTNLNGKIAMRTLTFFTVTSLFNTILGVSLATLIHPGNPNIKKPITHIHQERQQTSALDSLMDLGRNVFAENIFQATFEQEYTTYVNTTLEEYNSENQTEPQTILVRQLKFKPGTNNLGIVFFCLIFGVILGTLGERAKSTINFFEVTFEVVMKMVSGIIWFTPLCISSIIAGKVLSIHNLDEVFSQLAIFMLTETTGHIIYQFFIMPLTYFLIMHKNPYKFYLSFIEPIVTSFVTASALAALPLTLKILEGKQKVDKRITRFVVPLGSNTNMDGTALYISVATVFIAQMNGIRLAFGELVIVCITTTIVSFSSASIPSAAIILLFTVLSALDIPSHYVTLLFAVDWIADRVRTTNNLLGDCYASVIIEHFSKNELETKDTAADENESDEAFIAEGQKKKLLV